ncbi:MAG TPA: bifunctional UDP-N-acetylglucosamine diphosphorylase/glucosamine-1-phosphate N-acetyltransferase GlmU [Burkholderiales bacterium]|nr:bifunctional UDP-N-acetylglucosamine diphosphorylase/glucosamine-1-phosphate N-acetyltransferase GlmU [Burkholderiales bacterium]
MKKAPLNIVILAAGKGSRMHSRLPKVLHAIGGKPMLGHVLERAGALRSDCTIVVYGYGGQAIPSAFGHAAVEFVRQEPQLGTGHAVQQALPYLRAGGTTLVLYGDVPLTRDATLEKLISRPGLRLLTATLDDPEGYGRIVRDKTGRIVRIVEEKDASAQEKSIREINTGILCAPTDILHRLLSKLTNRNAQKEYYLTDIVALAIDSKTAVTTTQPADNWEILGVNSKDQLAYLERVQQLQNARGLMARGVTLADPWRFDMRGELDCGNDVFIDVNCIFEGRVRLADDVKVGAGCVLRNVDIGAGSEIAPYSHLDGAVVGANCRIGPYARLRPGTRLADQVHIGNFVETKATELGNNSKANHLSYLGDTTIGRDVNVGAGTITCNYDGANKHRTVIEDDAFIGSDTQLVAPVTVGRGATIGAGSTITKDAPADSLTLSRSKQVTIPGWKRPVRKNAK